MGIDGTFESDEGRCGVVTEGRVRVADVVKVFSPEIGREEGRTVFFATGRGRRGTSGREEERVGGDVTRPR